MSAEERCRLRNAVRHERTVDELDLKNVELKNVQIQPKRVQQVADDLDETVCLGLALAHVRKGQIRFGVSPGMLGNTSRS